MSPVPPPLDRLIDEVVRRSGVTGPSAQELRDDLERHFEEGLAAGRAPEELRRRFGDPARAAREIAGSPPPGRPGPRSTARTTWGGLFTDLVADLRHGVRTLLKRPGLALTTVLVFAIGIGANAVVFTIASELVLRPLAVEDPATLVDVWPDVPGGNSFLGFSWDDYTSYRDGTTTLETLAAFAGVRLHRGEAGEGQELVAQVVSPEYLPMLGLDAHLGSMRFPPDASFGEAHAAVLAYAVWRDGFGADPGIVGGTVQLDGTTVSVQGVAPPDFRGHFIGFPVDLWLPVASAPVFMEGFDPEDPASKPLEMIGRLRPGVGPDAAADELNRIAESLETRHPDLNRGHRVGVTRTTGVDHSLRASVDAFVGILVIVSILVLIAACLNVGSVLLVRALARERDMAIRLAIGAGHRRLVRQLFTEAGLLAALGAVSGVLLEVALNGWLAELVRTLTGGLGPELAIDGRTLVMTLGAALVAVLLAGGAPAFHVLRKDPAEALRSRDGDRGTTARVRSALVVGQVAVSVVLLAATGLFVRSLTEGARAHPGFDAERVSTFTLDLRELERPPEARAPVLRGVVEALRALPGVEAVTVASGPAVGVARTPTRVGVPGVEPPPGEDAWVVDTHLVGAGYLATLGIPLRSGRDLGVDDELDGPPVAIVNRALAERFWPGLEAVGRSVRVEGEDVRVVGVAEDARYLIQDETPDPMMYRSLAGRIVERPHIVLRSAVPSALAPAVRSVVEGAIPGHDPVSLTTASTTLGDALLPQRLGALLVGAMGLAALFLSGVGLYGLVQFTVTRSVHELGVRLALGGSRRDLLMVVLRKGFLLVAAGIGLGVVLAVPTARALGPFLGGVSPSDPLTFTAVIAVFTGVALAASWLPARRVAGVDPTEALRGE